MKRNAIDSLPYAAKEHIKNIAVNPIHGDSPAYIIDRQLLDYILEKFYPAAFDEAQKEIHAIADNSKTFEELASKLERFLYMNKIANHPVLLDEKNQAEDESKLTSFENQAESY